MTTETVEQTPPARETTIITFVLWLEDFTDGIYHPIMQYCFIPTTAWAAALLSHSEAYFGPFYSVETTLQHMLGLH